MKLSVIILNYKTPYHLLQCLQSVTEATAEIAAEIIVVDNHSEDQSCTLVKTYFPDVILVESEKNIGFSRGNNLGEAEAKGAYICLLNPDTIVGKSVFQSTLAFAEQHPDMGGIGVKMINGDGLFLPESKRNFPALKIAFEKIIGQHKKYYANHLSPNDSGEVDVLTGAFMLMKRERYREVDRLDEDYFMYGEDIDLSYKFQKAGYRNYYFGGATILHYKGVSAQKNMLYAKNFYGAMRLFYRKHFQSYMIRNGIINFGLKAIQFYRSLKPLREVSMAVTDPKLFVSDTNWSGRESVPSISESVLKKQTITQTALIFDEGYLPFQDIIVWIEKLSGHGNQFYIKPSRFDFVVDANEAHIID